MMKVRCRETAQLILVGKLVRDVAERATDAIIGPAEYLLQPADLGDPETRVAVDPDIVLDLLDIEAEPVIEPDNDGGRIDLRSLGFKPAVNIVVGIALDGLQIELAGDFHDRLRLQPVDLDRFEFAKHLA